MTKQATFDTVVAHLRKQGARATAELPTGDGGSTLETCVYRAPNGMKCAAGCLIPDEMYKPEFEKTRVSEENEVTAVICKLGHDVYLVSELQSAHDGYHPMSWERRFQEVAEQNNLFYSPVVKPVNGGQA